jgi:hypothetical protein
MMAITITCPSCGSGIHVHPSAEATHADCDVCQHQVPVKFSNEHIQGTIECCPVCERKDFYKQKDFNRKVGVILFVIAAILSIWTYGLSLVALWLVDLFLFKRLAPIVICYKCSTIFRNALNWQKIHDFDHEMHDRIVYKDHNFEGRPLEH